MKKSIQLFAGLLAALIVLLPSAGLTGMAVDYFTLRASKSSVAVNEAFTISVGVLTDEKVYGVQADITFDSTVLQYAGGDGNSATAGLVKIVDSKDSYTLQFKAIAVGSTSVTISGLYSGMDNTLEFPISGTPITVTVTAPPAENPSSPNNTSPLSDNASLSSLRVAGGTLSPKFSANTTSYRVEVANSVNKTTISATAADSSAKISGTGNVDLKVGENKKTVTVTAAKGNTKSYTLNIVRLGENETPSSETPAGDPLATVVGGKNYHVQENAAEQGIPSGFDEAEAKYNGVTVGVLQDSQGDYTLYVLKDDESGETDYYVYREDRDEFQKLPYMYYVGAMYIFAALDDDAAAPEGYHLTNINLNGNSVNVFASNDEALVDFYVIYCFTGGKYGFYSYDFAEGTLQRAPAFMPLKLEADDGTGGKPTQTLSLLRRFEGMTGTGQIVVITLAGVFLCMIALAVLLVIYLTKHRGASANHTEEAVGGFTADLFDSVTEQDALRPQEGDMIEEEELFDESDEFPFSKRRKPSAKAAPAEEEVTSSEDQ